jgi:chemotaxis regulatin CheY-phosphate phosphatase CheZ
MENQKKTATKRTAPNPETILHEIRERNALLDSRLTKLSDIIHEIRSDIREGAEHDLSVLSKASVDMLNGRVYQEHIDIQAKGELGILVKTFNQTLSNLQQLDATVKDQSTKVPELAAQLDSITADTEQATQNVMNRLDILMARADDAGRFFAEVQKNTEGYKANQDYLVGGIAEFLDRAKKGGDTAALAQEVLDYVFAFQVSPKPEPLDLSVGQSLLQVVSDEAFEILNILQFQDITRQKIEKVVQLLKQFRISLDRLLAIFKITEDVEEEVATDVFENRSVATQDNIFKTTVTASADTGSIDDIIAQFKAKS